VSETDRVYNILVVEDNPGDVHLTREALRETCYRCEITIADDTTTARELLKTSHFDLVISDMGVPNGHTSEFIRAMRADEKTALIPVVVLSGSADPNPAYRSGANAYISKTMDMDVFFAKMKALMHFWIEVAELPDET
jgi:CheY-like chemotaxis protein